MLSLLKDYKGAIEINGNMYNNISEAITNFHSNGAVCIRLNSKKDLPREKTEVKKVEEKKVHKIMVKQYMTRPATPEFDFMDRMNKGIPMPYRVMLGTVEKETPGMVYMKLHADITEERTMRCMCCGRILTNPVSQYFGIGPECGNHNYVNPFYNDEELKAAVAAYRTQLRNVTWEGWVIKSAILSDEIIEEEF